jgi:hypothetical protein
VREEPSRRADPRWSDSRSDSCIDMCRASSLLSVRASCWSTKDDPDERDEFRRDPVLMLDPVPPAPDAVAVVVAREDVDRLLRPRRKDSKSGRIDESSAEEPAGSGRSLSSR